VAVGTVELELPFDSERHSARHRESLDGTELKRCGPLDVVLLVEFP
jgi:hypothetical protein